MIVQLGCSTIAIKAHCYYVRQHRSKPNVEPTPLVKVLEKL